MKSARAARVAVACEFDEVPGGWMSPTAATCSAPPGAGGVVVGVVVVGAGAVVVGGGAVVVGGTVVVGAAVVVGFGVLTPPSIVSWGGVAVSRLANRPAALWSSSLLTSPMYASGDVVRASVSLPPWLMTESCCSTSVTSTSTQPRAVITGAWPTIGPVQGALANVRPFSSQPLSATYLTSTRQSFRSVLYTRNVARLTLGIARSTSKRR